MSRRTFLAMSGAAVVPSLGWSEPAAGYSLWIMATNWGYEGTWDSFAAKCAAAGYNGIEVWYPSDATDREQFQKAMAAHHLEFGFLVGASDTDFKSHLQHFRSSLEAAVAMRPAYINCHAGKDYFPFEQNIQLIELSLDISARSGVPVYHETHRSRILYTAPIARKFMEATQVKLTADLSHWCNVHESLLEDQQETIGLALSRTEHIHARIGHAEGPQVNDPRAPEWKKQLEAHLAWWDVVVQRKRSEGKRMTILTEFGPPDYMPTLPYSRQPVANQWEINVYMMNLLRNRYAS